MMRILELNNKFYKLAQQMEMGVNEKVKNQLETFFIPFVEQLFDKYISQPESPQDPVVEMKITLNTIIGEDKKPIIKLSATGNTEEIQNWANNILKKAYPKISSKVKEILSNSNFTIPFDADIVVNRKYE
jgi:hypothetical protein